MRIILLKSICLAQFLRRMISRNSLLFCFKAWFIQFVHWKGRQMNTYAKRVSNSHKEKVILYYIQIVSKSFWCLILTRLLFIHYGGLKKHRYLSKKVSKRYDLIYDLIACSSFQEFLITSKCMFSQHQLKTTQSPLYSI